MDEHSSNKCMSDAPKKLIFVLREMRLGLNLNISGYNPQCCLKYHYVQNNTQQNNFISILQ